MMNRNFRKLSAVAALTTLLLTQAVIADPLHKFGTRGEWRHADSGWIFPRDIGGLQRDGSPYTIDGNNDVGAEYTKDEDGQHLSVLVDLYLPDSAASGATLAGATASLLKGRGIAPDRAPESEQAFEIPQRADVQGRRFTFVSGEDSGTSQPVLYFFSASGWVVTVRTTAPAEALGAVDEFVRAMRWDTLGVYDDNMHGGGS